MLRSLQICCASILLAGCNQKDAETSEPDAHTSAHEVNHYGEVITADMLKGSRIEYFNATGITLSEAVDLLEVEANAYAKTMQFNPIAFSVEGHVGKLPVTLVVRNNSMRMICEALAEQTSTQIEVGDHSVRFGLGQWDGIE